MGNRPGTNALGILINAEGSSLYPVRGVWNRRAFPRATFYNAVLGNLIALNARGETSDSLLEDCQPSSSDSTKWLLTLRKDLMFHHGRPVSSADLEFSLIRHLVSPHETVEKTILLELKGATAIVGQGTYRPGLLPSVRLIDTFRLELELEHPNPNFSQKFTMSELSLVPAEELDEDFLSWRRWPIGAGPYRIEQCEGPMGPVTARLWPTYPHIDEQAPPLLHIMTNPSQGEVDLAIGFGEHSFFPSETLQRQVLKLTFAIRGIFFNYRCSHAQSEQFRAAVAAVLNRELIVRDQKERNALTGMIPRFSKIPNCSSSISVDEARSYFQEHFDAKKPILIPFRHAFLGGLQSAAWCKEVIQQLRDAGLPVELSEPTDTLFSPNNVTNPFEFIGIIVDCPDPVVTFQVFLPGGVWIPALDHPDEIYQDLVHQAARSKNAMVRKGLIEKLNQRFVERNFAVPLFEEKVGYWVNPERIRDLNESMQRQTLAFHHIHTH